jgi:hypothetical protein
MKIFIKFVNKNKINLLSFKIKFTFQKIYISINLIKFMYKLYEIAELF